LRAERQKRDVSLEHIAEVTRIPMRSLQLLEAGEFEALPGDVFVRGFVKAYADCLELDTPEVIERYTACRTPEPPAALHLEAVGDEQSGDPVEVPAPMLSREAPPRRTIGVTFALILLLLIATLTISYFLRSTDSGTDGVTMRSSRPFQRLARVGGHAYRDRGRRSVVVVVRPESIRASTRCDDS